MALNGATAPFGRKKVAPNPSQSETSAKGALVGCDALAYPDPNPAHPGTERLRRNRHTSLRSAPSFAPAPSITAWTCVDSCLLLGHGKRPFPPDRLRIMGTDRWLVPSDLENSGELCPSAPSASHSRANIKPQPFQHSGEYVALRDRKLAQRRPLHRKRSSSWAPTIPGMSGPKYHAAVFDQHKSR